MYVEVGYLYLGWWAYYYDDILYECCRTAATAAPTAAPDARSASSPQAKAAVVQDLQGRGAPPRW